MATCGSYGNLADQADDMMSKYPAPATEAVMEGAGYGNVVDPGYGVNPPVDPGYGVDPPVDPGYGAVDPGYGVDPNPGYGGNVDPGYGVDPNPGYGGGDGGYGGAVDPGYGVDPGYNKPGDDCEDCAELVKTTKKVMVPCTRNTYRQYEVKVPRTVTEKIARPVKYIDYEDRDKTVTYTVTKPETRYKKVSQQYTVPVTKTRTRMVNVTKKVPKTIYVDVTTQVEQPYTVVEQECRTKMVTIPYQVMVPEERTKIVQEKCPVEKTRIEYDDVCRTVYDTQIKTECKPVTKMITKTVPVYSWRPKPVGPCNECPPPKPPSPKPQPRPEKIVVKTEYKAPKKYDANNDGILDEEERAEAAAAGELEVVKREVQERPPPPGANVDDTPAVYQAPKRFDTNRDGILQPEEAERAAEAGQLRRVPVPRRGTSRRRTSSRRGGSRSRSGSRGRTSSSRRSSGRRRRRY